MHLPSRSFWSESQRGFWVGGMGVGLAAVEESRVWRVLVCSLIGLCCMVNVRDDVCWLRVRRNVIVQDMGWEIYRGLGNGRGFMAWRGCGRIVVLSDDFQNCQTWFLLSFNMWFSNTDVMI